MEPYTHPALEYHQPDETQIAAIKDVRLALSHAIREIVGIVPNCAERTLAIRKIEEAAMWANKAIVFDGERYL
jgi:hypothetical protein